MRFVAVNSKYSLVSHIFELGIFNDLSKSCIHLGPVGCLPTPNIFPLAKETFAKAKMFWNNLTNARVFNITLTRTPFIVIMSLFDWVGTYVKSVIVSVEKGGRAYYCAVFLEDAPVPPPSPKLNIFFLSSSMTINNGLTQKTGQNIPDDIIFPIMHLFTYVQQLN